jgi:hypothetical protein
VFPPDASLRSDAGRSKADPTRARIVWVVDTLHEPARLESRDEAGHSRLGEKHVLAELRDP